MSEEKVNVETSGTNESEQKIKSDKDNMIDGESPSSWKEQKSLLWHSTPLVLLFIISVFVQNIVSVFLFIALITAFDSVNDFIIQQSEKANGLSIWKILVAILYLVGCTYMSYSIICNYWIFSLNNIGGWFDTISSFWSTLYIVAIVDFLCKFLTMVVKCFILLLSGVVIPIHTRGRIHMACEGISQILRCIIPVPQWSKYILMTNLGVSPIICWCLVAIYLILKAKTVKEKFCYFSNPYKYKMLTGDQLQPVDAVGESGTENARFCPICHKNYVQARRLPCGHIFCHSCASLWFDREQHCPVCSSNSINALILGLQSTIAPLVLYTGSHSKWKRGNTDYVVQFF